jgi:hypothetical protein
VVRVRCHNQCTARRNEEKKRIQIYLPHREAVLVPAATVGTCVVVSSSSIIVVVTDGVPLPLWPSQLRSEMTTAQFLLLARLGHPN